MMKKIIKGLLKALKWYVILDVIIWAYYGIKTFWISYDKSKHKRETNTIEDVFTTGPSVMDEVFDHLKELEEL